MRTGAHNGRRRPPSLLAVGLIACLHAAAGGSDELFEISKKEEITKIEQDLQKTGRFLGENEIGKARDQLKLARHRLEGIKKKLSRGDRKTYGGRIDVLSDIVGQKEDSLIQANLTILENEGKDAALAYLRDSLRILRVSSEKLTEVDRAIAEADAFDAVAKQKEAEVRALRDAETAIRRGKKPEQLDDPMVRMAAERLYRAREDSIQAYQDSIRSVEEERQRLAELERKRQEEQRRKEQQRLAREQEKKRRLEEKAALEEAQRRAKLEKQRQEEIRRQQEQERQAELERKRREEARQAEREKEEQQRRAEREQQRLKEQQRQKEQQQRLKQQREQERLAKVKKQQEEQSRLHALEEKRKAEELAAKRERERLEKQRQARIEQERQEAEARARREEQRREEQRREEQRREEQRREELADQTQERERMARTPTRSERVQRIEAGREVRQTGVSSSSKPSGLRASSGAASASAHSATAGRKAAVVDKENANRFVHEIYSLVEQGKGDVAYDAFRRQQKLLKDHLAKEVYDVLESTVKSARGQTGAPQVASAAAGSASRAPQTEEQLYVGRINGLLRSNKVKPAYETFKRVKKQLKKSMEKKEFKILKERVTTAYKYYSELQK